VFWAFPLESAGWIFLGKACSNGFFWTFTVGESESRSELVSESLDGSSFWAIFFTGFLAGGCEEACVSCVGVDKKMWAGLWGLPWGWVNVGFRTCEGKGYGVCAGAGAGACLGVDFGVGRVLTCFWGG
jgi:hypothetical protein